MQDVLVLKFINICYHWLFGKLNIFGNLAAENIALRQQLIVLKMAEENPLWGAPTIHGELLKLGINISERTVSKLIRKRTPKPPSQTWRTFIKNNMTEMVAMDFHVVPTIRFRMRYVFVVLSHARRHQPNWLRCRAWAGFIIDTSGARPHEYYTI
ncbi:MAG: hypothetical protein FVQ79_13100 [Planctomycetes bacterium]|nr:hypothetical protein [Planctomycetota bacterium]